MKTNYYPPALVWLIKQVLSRKTPKPSNLADGFTLIESLVAVVVVSILLAGMAPFLAFTTQSRVQARRIDQATREARTYIERVQSGAIQVPTQFPNGQFNDPATYPNLNYNSALTALPTDPGTLVSTDNTTFSTSNTQHLVIQAIRSRCVAPLVYPACNSDLTAVRLQGYRLSVRVYRADAFNISGTPVVTLLAPVNTSNGSSYIQSGLSGTLGSQSRPLVVMQSDITTNSVGGAQGTTYTDYRNRLGN